MNVRLKLNPQYGALREFLCSLPTHFETLQGVELLHDGRNRVVRCQVQGVELVIKRFGSPSLVNRWVYGNIRQSKAMRAYDNGVRLICMNFLTPEPIAAIDVHRNSMLEDSYFVSLYSDFKPLSEVDNLPESDMRCLINQLAEVLALLHDKGIEHKDLNPKNIRYRAISASRYEFEFIDNNRMAFHSQLGVNRRIDDLRHFSSGTMPYIYLIDRYAEIVSQDDSDSIKLRSLLSRLMFSYRHKLKTKLKYKLRAMINQKNSYVLVLFSLLWLHSCVEYHPYDNRIKGSKSINRTNIERIEQECRAKTSIRFAVISDTQRWYDELSQAVDVINRMEDVDFVLHTGDISDFGMRSEFEIQRDMMNKLKVPYVCLIGNHDCIATGKLLFKEIFGESDFVFTAGSVRFISLNTNSLEFYSEGNVPNLGFMRDQVANYPTICDKSVVAMHAAPLSEQFDNRVAEEFHEIVKSFPGLQFCLHGHGHQYRVADLFEDGVKYYECENMGKGSLLMFTINDDGYECEKIDI